MLDLGSLNIKNLKLICKLKKQKGYSKLNKKQLIKLIDTYYASIRIQRFIRKAWNDERCPISLEPIVYPCYAFKPKGFTSYSGCKFIYYNLEPLVSYLLGSGDFRDPKTREYYSDEKLKCIDKLVKDNSLKLKSVYKAKNNKAIYRRNKEREDDIIVIERCIDEIVHSMRNIMETISPNDHTITLSSFHFPTFHRYFRNLLSKSEEAAKQLLNKTIVLISGPEQRPSPDPNNVKNLILQFLLTLEITYFTS